MTEPVRWDVKVVHRGEFSFTVEVDDPEKAVAAAMAALSEHTPVSYRTEIEVERGVQ